MTKIPVNGHAVSSGDQTGFGARARARHASREEGKDNKKNCLLCRPDKDGLVGPSFLGFSGYHKKPQKRRKHFPQGLPPSPYPHLAAFPDSTKLRATFSDRVFISATGNKHEIQRWRDASGRKNVLRKLLRILHRRLKAGFSVLTVLFVTESMWESSD